MPLIITKNGDRNFSHSDGFKTMNFSNWEIIFNETNQTVILQLPNGAPFPKVAVEVADVTVEGISYATTDLLRAQLVSVGYNPLVSSGGGEGGTVLSVNNEFPDELGDVNLTTINIPDALNKRYVTDAQLTVIGNTSGTNSGDNATNTQYSGLATSKQDVLTDVNFGNFMDVGLATKLTPMSTDNFLVRDSITDEAVEVPFSTVQQADSTFHIRFQASALASPLDSTTYYIGGTNNLPPATTDSRSVYAGITADKVRISMFIYNNGTLGTSENNTFNLINKTQATSVLITNTAKTNSLSYGVVADLTFAITQGDELSLQWITPAFATNPSQVLIGANALLRKT